MFDRLIASSPRSAAQRVVRDCALALAGHGAVGGVAVWATLQPKTVSAAGAPPVIITWPHHDQSGRTSAPPSIDPFDVAVPWLPPVDLPPLELPPSTGTAESARAHEAAVGEPSLTPAADGAPWTAALVEEPPALLAGQRPGYPDALRNAGITGRVVVEVVIDTLGRAEPGSAVVVQSSNAGFDRPARQYVLEALFRPARVHGRPVRVLVRVPIDFTLVAR